MNPVVERRLGQAQSVLYALLVGIIFACIVLGGVFVLGIGK